MMRMRMGSAGLGNQQLGKGKSRWVVKLQHCLRFSDTSLSQDGQRRSLCCIKLEAAGTRAVGGHRNLGSTKEEQWKLVFV